jgi:prophage regulatory protein
MAKLIPHADLAALGIPYSKQHLWRLEKAGRFPKRVPLSPGRYAYNEAEIRAYIEGLIEARDAGARTAQPKRKEAAAAA